MKKLVLAVVALCVALNVAWAACRSEARDYEDCLNAYTDGFGYCRVNSKMVSSKEVTAEMVNRARLKLDACIAGQIGRYGY